MYVSDNNIASVIISTLAVRVQDLEGDNDSLRDRVGALRDQSAHLDAAQRQIEDLESRLVRSVADADYWRGEAGKSVGAAADVANLLDLLRHFDKAPDVALAVHVKGRNDKIGAIKALRSLRRASGRDDFGLKEAKDAVEEYLART